ncbi:hypothetical protein JK361_14430 [Streptomyces sp. 5-8]|uniref:Uncharacterized protein n=1 Tax=Streptomyces musisoli TaxID=2802280 RepID=A0ABS1P0T2_9ACTN|nr:MULTISPECIES: hypothetical protein [Streptomyces]MBL1105765.1 hypothetical protein [Streptomyces musisoli]MBY8841653.1 hypothetical protein [Streptomyces sp. SP2-10]
MTLHIDSPAHLWIFAVACLAGYVTYKRTQPQPPLPPGPGDLGTAFAVGAIVLSALAFLFGVPTG